MSLFAPYKRNRISKSGKFCLWSQKSGKLGFELRNTAQGTRNSSSPDKEPGSTTWNLESTTSESKTVLVSFNGVTLHAWQISLRYSTRIDQWPLQCWRPSLLQSTMKRKMYLCLFSLKTPMKKKRFYDIYFLYLFDFGRFRSHRKRKHWPRLIYNFIRKMSMSLHYYPEIWRKIAKNT